MMIPLPLLRGLLDHGIEAGAAAGAGGADATGGAVGGAGAGTALKVGVVRRSSSPARSAPGLR